MIDNTLNKYEKCTKDDLREHPLAAQLRFCDSPSAILVVLQEQVQGLDQSQSTDECWTKWLDPAVNVLYAFSNIIGSGVSSGHALVGDPIFHIYDLCGRYFPPVSAIFIRVGVLLSVCIINNFVQAFVTHTSVRQLNMFEQAKTRLSTSSSGSKYFSASRDLHRSTTDHRNEE
jgi:hypothetical protein